LRGSSDVSATVWYQCGVLLFRLTFDKVIDDPLVGSSLVSGVNVVATYVALLMMENFKWRTFLLWSTGGILVYCVVLVLFLLHYFSNMPALVKVSMYVSFFEIGLGSIPFIIIVDRPDENYVTVVMSTSSQLNWVCNLLVGLVLPSMNACLRPYTCGVFAVVFLLSFLLH